MKKTVFSILAVASFISFLTINSAQAATFNYSFTSTDGNAEMTTDHPNGFIVMGDAGTVETNTDSNHLFDKASGTLAAATGIRFIYNLSTTTSKNTTAYVSPYVNGKPAAITTVHPNDFTAPLELGYSFVDGVSETIISQLTQTQFVVSIANLSASSSLAFSSYLEILGNFFTSGGNVDTRFETFVSAVPLPAALPLFAMGLAGLIGYKRTRKAKNAA